MKSLLDQKNLHEKLPMLAMTYAEDYRTMGGGGAGAVLIQFGTWHLHGFPEQRFELVQNGNGLSIDSVQMERGHANGRLIFK